MNQSEKKDLRYQAVQKVTLVGVVVNIVLALAQVIGGFIAQSQALIADGFHTLSDLITDFVVLVAAKMANKAPDEDHPYGHERIETVATIILGLALGGVGIGIALDAVDRLQNPEKLLQPGALAVSLAILAIVCKEGLYRYTYKVGKTVNSSILKANAMHHRSDAVSSVMVAIGVGASVMFSIPWLDALAAMAVAVMIFYMGAKLILDSTMELVDTAWETEKVESMLSLIGDIDGVQSAHMLRTRKMSSNVLVDVHIQVSPYISVSEGHHIAEQVMGALKEHYDEVSDIMVHIDPEDDETAAPSRDLPNRADILKQLKPVLKEVGLADQLDNVILHYLDGQIEVEITLSEAPSQRVLAQLQQHCSALANIRNVRVVHAITPA
ncbi:cation diffusion facilitator family transporter [Leucothrix pacifica]|uniref:Cation-efflux pump n=1 Tax=Leucothrix pacifica TaxID=1247513 RepID=A0A317CUW1_9GAMM|nr:cation diffusion facilitator family transporter [Leucothrix pacifica]PWR00113.1 cation-efflux pump [Leucothrix pacifica]